MSLKRYSLKFYADRRPDYLNKFFVFESDDPIYLDCEIYKFVALGNNIRACFLTDYEEKTNTRFSPQEITDTYLNVSRALSQNHYEIFNYLKDFQITHKKRLDYLSNSIKSISYKQRF